jgi:hypothetical protein
VRRLAVATRVQVRLPEPYAHPPAPRPRAAGSGVPHQVIENVHRTSHELLASNAAIITEAFEWVRDRQEAATKMQALLDQLHDVQEQRERLDDLRNDATCPICAQALGHHHNTVMEVLDVQLETITVDLNYYRGRLEQLEAVPPRVATLFDRRRRLLVNVLGAEAGRQTAADVDARLVAQVIGDRAAENGDTEALSAPEEATDVAPPFRPTSPAIVSVDDFPGVDEDDEETPF